MAVITDEQMKQISDQIGQSYAIGKDAIGDESTPGTSLFEVAKLKKYTDNLDPDEGITSGCLLSIATDTAYARVGSGTIRYEGSSISFTQTDVSIARTFQYPHAATDQYGIVVAFKRSELGASSTAIRTTIDATLTADVSTTVSVADATSLTQFDVPFSIQIGTENIEIWKVNDNGDGVISPSYNDGAPMQDHTSGTVAYVNNPLIPNVIVGLPIAEAYQSGDDPTTFDYYPPVSESSYILVGRGLVNNPNTTTAARTPELVAVEDLRDIVDTASENVFTATERQSIKAAADMFNLAIGYQSGFGMSENIMRELVDWSDDETGQEFTAYWNDRPFVTTDNYLRGESFWGISRFEFGDEFKEMYYDIYGSELLTTFAIFRGDIFGGQQTYGSPPANLTGSYTSVSDASSGNLSYGRWTYRITAITASGESSPSSAVTVSIPQSAGSTNKVTLNWDAVSGATSYIIYRLGSDAYRFIEYQLVAAGAVTGTTYDDIGTTAGSSVKRGVMMTGQTINEAVQLSVYVPPMSGVFTNYMDGASVTTSLSDSDTNTKNEMDVTVYGLKIDGTVGGPHTVNIPQGTARGATFSVGESSDVYINISDITISPGTDLTLENGQVVWSPYDLFVVQNV